MITNIREKCGSCCKNIYTHNTIVICNYCSKIAHAKSSSHDFLFDHLKNIWVCYHCLPSIPKRYNPFNDYSHEKYSQDPIEVFDKLVMY